nr:hypothetical protein [uncultured Desulfobacter sp.]
MYKGVQLSLMIGPCVPVPAPREVIDALIGLEVTSAAEGPSGFQLTFKLSARSPLHTLFLLSAGAPIPIIRVIILATVNGTAEVLMDGVMTHHSVSGGGTTGTTLTVIGEDLSRAMDYIDFSGFPYPCMPPEARVAAIIAKYAFLGIIPAVMPSVMVDIPIPINHIPQHRGTDLWYIQRLAENVGYTFYVAPGPKPGLSVAYWGPVFRLGRFQPSLNVDMDAHTNVESLNFEYDTESATLPFVYLQEPTTKAPIPVPIPDVSPLNPPLGAIAPIPKKIETYTTGTAKYSPVRALMVGMAKRAKTTEAVTATGSLQVARYGRLLKARRLVAVRGAGLAFDGLYFVKKVTHKMKRGEYTQDFALVRNGLVSTIQKVPA